MKCDDTKLFKFNELIDCSNKVSDLMVNAEQSVTLNEPDVNFNCNSHHHKRICKVNTK